MNFAEWKKWKETQDEPTCDHVGCQSKAPRWLLPQSRVCFCVGCAAELGGQNGLAKMYSENPRMVP